jgi:TM2 domain-containing membrane protein YozV
MLLYILFIICFIVLMGTYTLCLMEMDSRRIYELVVPLGGQRGDVWAVKLSVGNLWLACSGAEEFSDCIALMYVFQNI